jgi:hypothetical protein
VIRDYGDLYRLLRASTLHDHEVSTALEATAKHRRITLRPLSTTISDLPQHSYTAWLRRQGPTASGYPTSFTDTVAVITAFADPLISGEARGKEWDPENARWTESTRRLGPAKSTSSTRLSKRADQPNSAPLPTLIREQCSGGARVHAQSEFEGTS